MGISLAPSILSFDPADFRSAVGQIMEAGVEWIHFDVMDGQFVPPITFGADLVRSLRSLGATPFEVHLMTETPERHFEAFIGAGCTRVVFHAEATAHSHRLIQQLKSMGVQAGLAVNPGTPIDVFEPVIDLLDLALIMTVNPGWGGQKLIPSCVEKVRDLRAMSPGLEIEVDGGVDSETIREIWEAGANTFVAGSFVSRNGQYSQNIEALRAACALKS